MRVKFIGAVAAGVRFCQPPVYWLDERWPCNPPTGRRCAIEALLFKPSRRLIYSAQCLFAVWDEGIISSGANLGEMSS